MLSSVYQLAAADNPAFAGIDPDNRFFWRFNRQRLTAEAIRDGLLAVSGTLDREVGGESLQLDDEENHRRTLYSEVSRFQLHEYLQTFDFPNPSLTAERRYATNVPLQSLYFMNSDFVHRQADAFVRRLAEGTAGEGKAAGDGGASAPPGGQADGDAVGGGGKDRPKPDGAEEDGEEGEVEPPESFDDRAMIRAAYPLLYGREATTEEMDLGLEFLGAQRAEHLQAELEALVADEDGPDDAGRGDEGGPTGGELAPEQGDGGATTRERQDRELAERRASMKAWVQYARALFSAAEFRFIS